MQKDSKISQNFNVHINISFESVTVELLSYYLGAHLPHLPLQLPQPTRQVRQEEEQVTRIL